MKNLRRLAYEFEVNTSGWPKETRVERESKTCVQLSRLASPFARALGAFERA